MAVVFSALRCGSDIDIAVLVLAVLLESPGSALQGLMAQGVGFPQRGGNGPGGGLAQGPMGPHGALWGPGWGGGGGVLCEGTVVLVPILTPSVRRDMIFNIYCNGAPCTHDTIKSLRHCHRLPGPTIGE